MTDIKHATKNAYEAAQQAIIEGLGDHASDRDSVAGVLELLVFAVLTSGQQSTGGALHNLAVFSEQVRQLMLATSQDDTRH